jgi:molybdopterin/thiamine biosynthesis adenylyltransferase
MASLPELTDEQLLRYARHVVLDEVGEEGQAKLLQSSALIVGAGGLGSPLILYLAAAGIGRIGIVDNDTVDVTNLQRQIAHTLARVGQPKAESARTSIGAINPDVQVHAQVLRADGESLLALVAQADVVLDCTDNFKTRHAINAACVRHAKPLVAGAAIRFDGQISVYDVRDASCPCYACVFPPDAAFEDVQCSTLGVFAPLVGIIGTMQAAEALKILAGVGTSLAGRLQMLDARTMQWSEMRLARRPDCPVCRSTAARTAA